MTCDSGSRSQNRDVKQARPARAAERRVEQRIATPTGSVIRSLFTHRTHYGAPKPRGHRQWLDVRHD
jgi:hypothetical protein